MSLVSSGVLVRCSSVEGKEDCVSVSVCVAPHSGLLSPSGHISEQLWLLSLCVCMYWSRVRSVAAC